MKTIGGEKVKTSSRVAWGVSVESIGEHPYLLLCQ